MPVLLDILEVVKLLASKIQFLAIVVFLLVVKSSRINAKEDALLNLFMFNPS